MKSVAGWKVGLLILCCAAWGPGNARASDDFQYWSWATLKTALSEDWVWLHHGQLRLLDDARDDDLYMLSERLHYRGWNPLDLGIHYTYLSVEVRDAGGADEMKYQHRLELEANPRWDLGESLKIKNRNRLEYRWIEDKGSDNTRFRHRWGLEIPLKDQGPLQAFYANNEFFYDIKKSEYNENRLVPAGIRFKVHDRVTLSVFYMMQSKRGANDWSSNQILGTHVVMSL